MKNIIIGLLILGLVRTGIHFFANFSFLIKGTTEKSSKMLFLDTLEHLFFFVLYIVVLANLPF